MESGKLRHRVIIEKRTTPETQGDLGEPTTTWVTHLAVYAQINPLQGREFYDAQRINPELTHNILIRYREGITPDMRISFGTRTFEIISIVNVEERNRELRLVCKESL